MRTAEKAGLTPQAYVDKIVAEFQEAWRVLRVEPDQFFRTTDPRHVPAVQELFRRAHAAGDVYENEYEGLYCQGCEAFYQEKDLVDGKCPVHLVALETVREKNFFFRLSKYAQPLLDHIAKEPGLHPAGHAAQRSRERDQGRARGHLGLARVGAVGRAHARLDPEQPGAHDLRVVRRADQLHLGARLSGRALTANGGATLRVRRRRTRCT
jgi:hypothetical protein